MARVACIGISVLDLVLRVDTFPRHPGKYRASERLDVGGGVAANAAATVVALGGESSLLSAVGTDPTGDRILEDLHAYGVETVGVRRVDGAQSPLSMVLVDGSGERLIVNHASADLFERAEAPKGSEIAGADGVLADMRWPEGALVGLEAAARSGRPAVLDCDHDPTGHERVLAAASHAVFALPTLVDFVGVSDPAAALIAAIDLCGGMPIATDGEQGVFWLDDGECRHLPAFDVDVVDTLGAGDVFHGAFALAVCEGRPLTDALRWASAAAAVKCTRFGGRAGIPSRTDVDRFLKERL